MYGRVPDVAFGDLFEMIMEDILCRYSSTGLVDFEVAIEDILVDTSQRAVRIV